MHLGCRRRHALMLPCALVAMTAMACSHNPPPSTSPASSDHAAHAAAEAEHEHVMPGYQDANLPASADNAKAKLAASTRHGEWVMISTGPSDSIRAWVVYPERSAKAPVVVVVHEIFGLTTWVRAVADQFAASGFIAVAPDLLTNKHIPGSPDSINTDSAVAAIRTLNPADIQRQLLAVAKYAMALPAALPRYGIVGFCWGGGVSFAHATASPSLRAAVVYYGVSPDAMSLAKVRAPVLGLYAENDARVDMTIPTADSALKALGVSYAHTIYPGAGHGFLRDQAGKDGANLKATRDAWPKTISFFRDHLEEQR